MMMADGSATGLSSSTTVKGRSMPTRGPFPDDAAAPKLVHCAHHKVGTVWFTQVLRAVAREWGLSFAKVALPTDPDDADALLYPHADRFDRKRFEREPFRGSHMVRDPRDVIVSAYFYHRWTPEAWAQTPRDEHGGLSYQEYLNSLPQEEGLLAEIRYNKTTRQMAAWDYEQPEFLELRYENVLGDEHDTFLRIFHHYGFTDAAATKAADIATRFNFDKVTKRRVGEVKAGAHLRSGKPGEWRELFGEAHRALFLDLHGDALVRLGYEDTDDW